MAFKTRLTELFGIEHPILAGGLMWLADANYAAGAVNAGAMGFITAKSFPDPGAFRAELRKARELTGGKPFGVNLYISVHADDSEALKEPLGIALEEGVRFFETAGRPPRLLMPMLSEAGAKVIHKVASVKHAVSAQKLGVDAVAIVGAECGGHPGLDLIGTMVQTPMAADRVTLPYAVGGGIGTGSQIAAALAMGADAVVIGSRFLVADEIWSARAVKEEVVAANETGSRTVMATFRNTMRVLDNDAARKVAEMEAAGIEDFEAYRPILKGTEAKHAYETGETDRGLLSLGQSAVFADRIEPMGSIIAGLMAGAEAARARLIAM
ncbi:MAG: nitronate monooxygenase [Alphaproteobacteria bacterium]|nr:nitronate monooxygenase [Alphaproteobacteria bacterium]